MFAKSGTLKSQAYNGADDDLNSATAFYAYGLKVKADSDDKYEIYKVSGTALEEVSLTGKEDVYANNDSTDEDDYLGNGAVYTDAKFSETTSKTVDTLLTEKCVLISSTGARVKSGTKKTGDGYKVIVKTGYVAAYYDPE